MTSKELFKAKEILKENNISASPIEFWETEKYYQIAYITYAGNFFIDRFNKQMNTSFQYENLTNNTNTTYGGNVNGN